jgi:hypothetical protein
MLKTHVEIDLHTGDNLHSDIRSAQAHGVRARYTDASKRRPTEEFLKSEGLLELCKLIRELRLSQHDENPLLQKWSEMQIEHNIPLLVLSSIHILAECIRRDVDNVQFSSRDCFFLKRIFEKINTFKPDIKTSYFYTSRLARLSKSADYMNYVRASAYGNPLIVDLCGTGWSLTAMLGDAGVSAPFYLVHDISGGASCAQYMAIRDVGPGGDRSFFLKDERLDNSVFEKLNYVNHGSVLGVRRIPELNQFIPLHRAPNYPPEIQMYINSTQALVEQFSTILRSYDVNRMFAEAVTLGGKFQSVFKALYEHTLTTVRFTPAFERYHAEEGLDVMAVLRGDRKNI